MAKYAIGFVVAFVLVGLFLVAGFGFGLGSSGVRGFGGVGVEVPVQGEPPVAVPDPRPPDLIVTDADNPLPIEPYTYCWTEGNVGTCVEGSAPDQGFVPAFVSTDDTMVHLDFQIEWDVAIEVEPQDGSCPPYSLAWGTVSNGFVDTLGPPGEYVLNIQANAEQGDAHWVIRIDNEADLPLPAGITC